MHNVWDGALQYGAALEAYESALELKPDLARAFYNKAVVYWRKGDYAQAWLNVDKCRELGSEPSRSFTQKLARDSGRQEPPGGPAPEGPVKGETGNQP